LQAAEWGPLRTWFEKHLGVKLAIGRGFSVPTHPPETMTRLESVLKQHDDWELCAIEVAASTAKSVITGCALVQRDDVTPELAMRWALLEEMFQIERWGLVEGEHDVSHEETLMWLRTAKQFILHRRATEPK